MIYLNGKYIPLREAKIEPNDRGFLLSDGVFETIRVYSDSISCLSDHYLRLRRATEYLGIPLKMTFQEMEEIIKKY